MIRRDGRAFPCGEFVYCDGRNTEEALLAAEWLYHHTARDKTRSDVLRLFKTYGLSLSCYRSSVQSLLRDIRAKNDDFLDRRFILSIADLIEKAPMGRLSALITAVRDDLNDEFLRASGAPTIGTEGQGSGMQFRVSSNGYDWFPVIRGFLSDRRDEVSSVSVVREERCAC